jgi:5,10-methylenetetrahydromethanopterin reductase
MSDLDVLVIPEPDLDVTVDLVRFLERSGFHRAWIADSPPLGWPDVHVTLGLCAAATSRIRLGPGVTNPLTRHSSVTANALVTLHRLSGGRADLGIGVGYSAVRAVGMKPATLGALADHVADVRRVFDAQRVSIPLYVAASGPRALLAAGRLGDGAMVTVGTHPALVRRAVATIGRGAEEAGRDPRGLDLVFLAGLAISDDPAEARREAAPVAARRAKDAEFHPEFFLPPELEHLRRDAEAVARHYDVHRHVDPDAPHNRLVTDELVDALTLAGTPERCAEKIAAMRDAGATRVAPFPAGTQRRRALELFLASEGGFADSEGGFAPLPKPPPRS